MRTLEYLSPSSIKKWLEGPEPFYLHYLTENRPPREPQTRPMASGSAFDAYTKSYLHEKLFGPNHDVRFTKEAIFEAQVEPHNRDWAKPVGEHLFEQYRSSGALADLMTDLGAAQGTPRFEFEVRGAVHGYRQGFTREMDDPNGIGNVVLLGKPDVHFVNKEGMAVILDWKVNGYCSTKTPPSPKKGYMRMRSAGKTDYGSHRDCMPMVFNGVRINCGDFLETIEEDWARQLSIYGWLCGEPVGAPFVLAIDQIVCDATRGPIPGVRIAEHRCRTSERFQNKTFHLALSIWEIVQSGHIFRGTPEEPITLEQSQARCEALDGVKAALAGDGDGKAAWFNAVTNERAW